MKPAALRPGDLIGLVSASSPVTPEQLARLTGYLEGRGHPVKIAAGVGDHLGYLAGTAQRRAAGVMAMFTDPEVRLVLPVTGGSGALDLTDRLDYAAIRGHPKLFASFSNPANLGTAMLAAAGLATLHGVTGFQFCQDVIEPSTERDFWDMVSGPVAGREIAGPGWRVHRRPGRPVAGPLIGGNLFSVFPLAGTRWMPPAAGAILFLENFRASYEMVELALTQMRLAGVFDGIAALVVGAPADWPREDAPDAGPDELVLRCVGGTFPVITNVPFGHQPARIQLPQGCRAELDASGEIPVLRYLEDLVAPG